MYREKDKRTKLGVIYTIIVVIIAIVSIYSIYQQHRSSLNVKESTFHIPNLPSLTASQKQTLTYYDGKPYPSMGSGYQLVFKSPSNTGRVFEEDYLTPSSLTDVINNAKNVCLKYNFTVKKTQIGYDIIGPQTSYGTSTVQCYDKDDSWSFAVEKAQALSTTEYVGNGSFQYSNQINGQVPKTVLDSPLSSELWLDVKSLGLPTVKCSDSSICYIQKSSLVNGS